jgi:hypothetical protein
VDEELYWKSSEWNNAMEDMNRNIMKEEEDYNAGDKCGRCGCARRDHAPSCKDHIRCNRFSNPISQKPKTRKKK